MVVSSSASRNFPTLRHLAAPARWLFRSRRRVMTAAAVLLAMLIAPPLWWSIQLLGLPDIGEPFDIEAFRSFRIPDETNAFVLYRRAAERFEPMKIMGKPTGRRFDERVPWAKADPIVRRWVETNREALDLFRRGSERPDAQPPGAPLYREHQELLQALGSLNSLALLEASRLEGEGDMAGAWTWYRAALRAASHLGMRGAFSERYSASFLQREVRRRLDSWAANPRTTPAMLRQALGDAVASGALVAREGDSIRVNYRLLLEDLDRPQNPGRQMLIARLKRPVAGPTTYILDWDVIDRVVDAWRFWRREPERSRRVIRLAVANWLAYDDLPPDRRPAPSPDTVGVFDFYALGPDAPAGARALSPESLDRWMSTAADARELLRMYDPRGFRARDLADRKAVVILLASQLYRRDHGADPPNDEALVGPYLKELPDDGMGAAWDRGQRPGE